MTSSSTDCATMMISGQMVPVQSSAIALLRGFRVCVARERRAFRHRGGGARDRVGQIEVGDSRAERRLVGCAAARGKLFDVGRVGRRNLIDTREMRVSLKQSGTQLAERVVRQLLPELI